MTRRRCRRARFRFREVGAVNSRQWRLRQQSIYRAILADADRNAPPRTVKKLAIAPPPPPVVDDRDPVEMARAGAAALKAALG